VAVTTRRRAKEQAKRAAQPKERQPVSADANAQPMNRAEPEWL